MRRIGSKLFAGFLCMAALTAGVLWLLQAGVMRDNYLRERVAAVDGAVRQATTETEIDFTGIEERLNVRMLMLNADGSVGYVSPGMPMKGMLLKTCQGMDAKAADGEVRTVLNAAGDAQYALLGRPLPSGGTLFAVFSLTDVREASRILMNQLWIVTAVMLAASVLLALVLSRMFSRPVREITGAARSMAEGKLDAALPVRSRDEIGQLAAALNGLGEQLQRTENLRRELIANVSHELRSPLAVIQGYAETVRDVTWPHEEKRRQQLTIVADEAARLSRIVADILDYSKLQAGVEKLAPVEFELLPELRRHAGLYELEAAARSVQIRVACGGGIAVRFDRDRFGQVVDNLLGNAINHADAGSTVELTAKRAGEACRISVTNAGQTIAPEDLPNIWDRYYRARSVGEGQRLGTGLGLAIVKSILERHGSSFGATSENGVTQFWFEAACADKSAR